MLITWIWALDKMQLSLLCDCRKVSSHSSCLHGGDKVYLVVKMKRKGALHCAWHIVGLE